MTLQFDHAHTVPRTLPDRKGPKPPGQNRLFRGPRGAYGLLILGVVEIAGGRLSSFCSKCGSQRWATSSSSCASARCGTRLVPDRLRVHRQQAEPRYLTGAAVAAVLNVGINVTLIPLIGAIGAAIATAVAFGAACLVWLALQRPLTPSVLALLGLLTTASGAAVLSVHLPGAGVGIGGATVALAVGRALSAVMPNRRRQIHAEVEGDGMTERSQRQTDH